jgi:hypothetical protein
VLNPTFEKSEVAQLEKTNKLSRAFDGTTYRPGITKIITLFILDSSMTSISSKLLFLEVQ